MKDMFDDANQAEALRQIAREVAALSVPSLTPLRVWLRAIRAGIGQRRSELLLEAQDAREEGFAAAARLAFSVNEDASAEAVDYFQQLVKETKR